MADVVSQVRAIGVSDRLLPGDAVRDLRSQGVGHVGIDIAHQIERLAPRRHGRSPVAAVALAVAEVVQRNAFVELLADRAEEFEGALETPDRLVPVTHRVADEPGAVPGHRLAEPVAELVQSVPRPQAPLERLRVPAEAGLGPADAVERVGPADLVTGQFEQPLCLPRVRQRLLVPSRLFAQATEAVVGGRLARGVGGRLEQCEGRREMITRVREPRLWTATWASDQ